MKKQAGNEDEEWNRRCTSWPGTPRIRFASVMLGDSREAWLASCLGDGRGSAGGTRPACSVVLQMAFTGTVQTWGMAQCVIC